jgi:hypothetical protein
MFHHWDASKAATRELLWELRRALCEKFFGPELASETMEFLGECHGKIQKASHFLRISPGFAQR